MYQYSRRHPEASPSHTNPCHSTLMAPCGVYLGWVKGRAWVVQMVPPARSEPIFLPFFFSFEFAERSPRAQPAFGASCAHTRITPPPSDSGGRSPAVACL